MMTQEDGFIEVKVNLFNRNRLTKRFRRVYLKKLPLLFDTHAMLFISLDADLDFVDVENLKGEELLAWIIYGGYKSYAISKNRKPYVDIEDVTVWVKGMLNDERIRVLDAWGQSKAVGKLTDSYLKARNEAGEGKTSKKAEGSVLEN